MATWKTPKTDWYGATVDGEYTGDRFNATDYNRIKNNIDYLHDLAVALFDDFSITDMGNDKTYSDYFYADEINTMWTNVKTINSNSVKQSYPSIRTYAENGTTMTYDELNIIESAILDLYERLNKINSYRTFVWNFGIKGGL